MQESAPKKRRGTVVIQELGNKLAKQGAYDVRTSGQFEALDRTKITVRGQAFVIADGKHVQVSASENAFIEAHSKSLVIASGDSICHAFNTSNVHASDRALVVARDKSTVRANGQAIVRAYDWSTVIAAGDSTVIAYSERANIELRDSAVLIDRIDQEPLVSVATQRVDDGTRERSTNVVTLFPSSSLEV